MNKDCRDRTNEFFSTVSSLQKAQQQPLESSPLPLLKKTRFSQEAARTSGELSAVTQKLEKLAILARRSTLFDDRGEEINELIYTIKTDLSNLKGEIDDLEKIALGQVQVNKEAQASSGVVVQKFKVDLATTMKEFGDILNTRTQNLKAQNSRRKEFESTSRKKSRRNGSNFKDMETSLSTGNNNESAEGEAETSNLLTRSHQVQQQTLAEQVQERDEYLLSRQNAMEEIQTTIAELGQMYQRFSTLVEMQNEVVIKIDEHMDATLENVDKGHKELITLFNYKNNSTWLIIKIFAIVIFFVFFFLVFL